jgi:alkanesulfonate monooxygenase SsuD/methylene tetrahydromethanopterin reductase-like flavin-dependent oxidoreductase (luciferase family)
MSDVGAGPPIPTDRRYSQEDFWFAQERLLKSGVLCEELGFDSFWLTEHHFQYEGYEVVPNGLLFGTVLAERTSRIRIGTMFNIVPQWHPLRLAEDFAFLHNISGGRAILGVGRGTVPREAEPLGTRIGSFDNPDREAADRANREAMDEAMAVITLALDNETFAFHGDHFDFPPPGIPDRGGTVQELTLIPRPRYPYDIWQAVTSPPTLKQVATKGHGAVFWLRYFGYLRDAWEEYAEVSEQATGSAPAPGEKRMLVLNTRVEDTHEAAWKLARPGHDEFWKFLAPYGWSRGYRGADGKPAAPGLIPTLEESVEQKAWIIGSPEEVAEGVAFYRDLVGLENLTIVPAMPGDSYDETDEQLSRLSEQVLPLLEG